MLAFAIFAALLGLLGPFLLISFFIFLGRARIKFRFLSAILIAFSPSGAISTSSCIYPSSLQRLLVLGLEGGGGGRTSISTTTLLPGLTPPQPPPRPRPLLPDMNKLDCRSSDRGEASKKSHRPASRRSRLHIEG